ncbi:DUF2961 domain-containing protein [Telmatospirillum sp. J64-1]|uniref:DUF2961 domain-containing protein n=1 Tax=Telmatospirillum sp. J64-1 TaxID=2502183 RepID=UPI00115D5992|nr:DUF2961 domain-containing protein [Telmatospirillum sp. J64-1]
MAQNDFDLTPSEKNDILFRLSWPGAAKPAVPAPIHCAGWPVRLSFPRQVPSLPVARIKMKGGPLD